MTLWAGSWLRVVAVFVLLAIPGALPAASSEAEGADAKHHESDSEPIRGKEKQEVTETTGVLGKPVRIKGAGITLLFGGFAKVDFIQDFDPIGNQDQFKVNSIPVEGSPDAGLGGSTNISAKQTRLSLDVRGDTTTGQVRGYIEGDFFGEGNSFRLRHGYGEWKGLLGGQTWTTFQDISARPFTLDYEGPDSEIFVRQPMIRYTGTPSQGLEWSVAVEDPDSQITVPDGVSGEGRSEFPDLPARVRVKRKWGHIQVAALVRQLRFVSDGGVIDESATGYGLNFSGKGKVLNRDAVMGEIAFGTGIGRYIESFGGTNSDAVLTADEKLEPIDAMSGILGYTHHWNDRYHSTISGGFADLEANDSQPDDAIRFARSAHLNLVYAPNRLLNIGGEIMWGRRENKDGARGDATRFQISLQYKFR